MVGMGRIGQAIGRRLEASRVPVVYHSRNPADGVSYQHYPDLIEMAKAVDTLVVIVPGGAATAKMINAEVMKALGPRGVIINVARGTVVDEQALIAALKSGTILAAGLDVFDKEPNVPDELKAMQNVVLLPHIGSASVVTRNAMDQLVVDNLKAWFAGKPPLTPVAETPAKSPLMRRRGAASRLRRCWRRSAGASPARSQDAATLKKDMIGQWELSTTERSKTCVVTLKSDATPQGLKLELEPGCATALPFTKDITAWSIKGLGDIVRLQDAAGQPVIDFTEVETGIFEGLRTGEGIYILQNLAAARSLAKSMDQMIGDWAMVRGNGQTICGLTLTNTEAGQDNFQVFLKPKCDPAVAAFAPTQWRLEHGQILLMSASGETWQFEADDNAQWRRVPDSADPLIMLRQ